MSDLPTELPDDYRERCKLQKDRRVELDLKLAYLRHRLRSLESRRQKNNDGHLEERIKRTKKKIRVINEELARREEEGNAKGSKRRHKRNGFLVLSEESRTVFQILGGCTWT